ncbi:MAG TPA: PEP-CTERM sorting domain-containing protein [Verrucomicrobiales bacterium]|jgi:hypothetical protein|nr:PEP-CTERM sorting domain-containing protein [Verrucomicrobiales bacterium]
MKTSILAVVVTACLTAASGAATVLADKVVVTRTTAFPPAFHIAEVQVFEQGTGTNVAASAAGSSAAASSTGWGTSPAWAIDGNTDGAFGSNSTWHDTDGEGGDNPGMIDQLTITFSSPKSVDNFNLWGRTDCCPERDDSIRVEFFNGATLVGQVDTGIINNFNTGVTPITAVVPEPASGILALALAGLMWRRRRV